MDRRSAIALLAGLAVFPASALADKKAPAVKQLAFKVKTWDCDG